MYPKYLEVKFLQKCIDYHSYNYRIKLNEKEILTITITDIFRFKITCTMYILISMDEVRIFR